VIFFMPYALHICLESCSENRNGNNNRNLYYTQYNYWDHTVQGNDKEEIALAGPLQFISLYRPTGFLPRKGEERTRRNHLWKKAAGKNSGFFFLQIKIILQQG